MPLVAVASAIPLQIGPRALAAPQVRMVVNEFAGNRVMAVALGLRAERTDHLRMAIVAALADVDVTPGELQRGVRLQSRDRFGGGSLKEQRDDLHESADTDDQDDEHDHHADILFDEILREFHISEPSGL